MKFFELVRKYNHIKYKISSKINEENELRELGQLPKVDYGGMPGSPGYHGSPTESFVVKLDQIQQDQKELNKQLEEVRNDIVLFIDTLDDYFARRCVEMVIFRTTHRPNWKEVARRIGYSESGTRSLYSSSTKKLQNLEKEELKNWVTLKIMKGS